MGVLRFVTANSSTMEIMLALSLLRDLALEGHTRTCKKSQGRMGWNNSIVICRGILFVNYSYCAGSGDFSIG